MRIELASNVEIDREQLDCCIVRPRMVARPKRRQRLNESCVVKTAV